MRSLTVRFARVLMLAAALCATMAGAQQGAIFSREQLDQMMAPVALYPDALLSQVLMASTYPADVADAAKWSKANPRLSGDTVVKAVQNQPWDPSVQSLVAFPQVIQMMGEQPDWVQKLGDAFLASSKDVLDSAQRLRTRAQQQGSLKSDEQQKIIVEQEPQTQETVIRIEPTDPEVVFVPVYEPAAVYGAWPYPDYPPDYYPPAAYSYWYPGWYPGVALPTGIAFGLGIAAAGALWGNCNWGGGNVNVNVNRFNSINRSRQLAAGQTAFQHNAANRRGVPYRDARSQQQFGRGVPGAEQRADFRGRDAPGRDAQRRSAQSALQQSGMDPTQGRQNLLTDPATRERAQRATAGDFDRGGRAGDRAGERPGDLAAGQSRAGDRGTSAAGANRGGQFPGGGSPGGRGPGFEQVQSRPGADNALRGAGSAGQVRPQMDRGAASRQSMASHGAGRAPGYGSAGRAGGGGTSRAGGVSGGGGHSGGGRGGGGRGGGGGGGRR